MTKATALKQILKKEIRKPKKPKVAKPKCDICGATFSHLF